MQCRLFYCIMENEQRGMITFILAVCGNVDYVYSFPQSPPSRAAWIEITFLRSRCYSFWSPPSRAAWIEISNFFRCHSGDASPPSRAAWIEIQVRYLTHIDSPGRRLHGRRGLKYKFVILRISTARSRRLHGRRGLKSRLRQKRLKRLSSPPSRAAWIEISDRI